MKENPKKRPSVPPNSATYQRCVKYSLTPFLLHEMALPEMQESKSVSPLQPVSHLRQPLKTILELLLSTKFRVGSAILDERLLTKTENV